MVTSDLLSEADWKATQLYQRFYRPYKIQDSLGLDIDLEKGCMLSLDIGRFGRRGFTAEEKQALTLLVPHIQQIYQRLISARSYRPGGGWISLDHKGKLQTKGASVARDLLSRYLDAQAIKKGKLPASLLDWFQNLDLTKKKKEHVFRKTLGSSTLMVAAFPSSLPGGSSYFLVTEESRAKSALLTAREKEILSWLTESKTNYEIARLLEIREGTVKRHLENIYKKLGMENRQGASLYALRNGLHPHQKQGYG